MGGLAVGLALGLTVGQLLDSPGGTVFALGQP